VLQIEYLMILVSSPDLAVRPVGRTVDISGRAVDAA
jgi:hypothetical protein